MMKLVRGYFKTIKEWLVIRRRGIVIKVIMVRFVLLVCLVIQEKTHLLVENALHLILHGLESLVS